MNAARATLARCGTVQSRGVPGSAGAVQPARITLLTCIGCGAMSGASFCPGGCCGERRIELVRAAVHDSVCAEVHALVADVEQMAAALGDVAALPAAPEDLPDAFASARRRASVALGMRGGPLPRQRHDVEPVEAWRCPSCGGIDAPQPCIGVCIRVPVEWVPATQFAEAVARRDVLAARRRELAAALTALVHLRPRPGRELENWEALRRRAAAVV